MHYTNSFKDVYEKISISDWNGGETQAFTGLMKALRVAHSNSETDMDLRSFTTGPFTLFGFDVSRDRTAESTCRAVVNTSIEFEFKNTPVPPGGLVSSV